ncbi:GntR family transcriptional regulator [Lederbergia sp. NSJ-179]|uniref:GntR family transcriptional regulator n=1 Tax=Lederbergia sp. NSJ-179 TaxID=2931402 RepID=UPI0037BEF972
MHISRKKGPLYLQIRDHLRDRILHGVYPIHVNIPSEAQLENEFGVSKITVRKAIEELVQEGYLEKKSGKGTKVIRNTLASTLSKGKLFTEFLVEEGHRIQKQLLKVQQLSNKVDSKIFGLFGEQCLYIERLYYLDQIPYIHFTHYLTGEIVGDERTDLNDWSLYQLIREQGISLNKFQDQFVVSSASPHIEDYLHVNKGTPLLKRIRYSYDDNGHLIEYSEGFYKTDEHPYIVHYDV